MRIVLFVLAFIVALVLVFVGAAIYPISIWFWVANGVSFCISVAGGYFLTKMA